MKTIFITSFHLLISRNILATDILKTLRESGAKIVIVVPSYKKEYFEKTFGGGNVIVEGVVQNISSRSKRGLVFKRLAHMMLNTDSIRIYQKYRMFLGKPFAYRIFFKIAQIFGRSLLLLRCIRFLDFHFTPRGFYDDLFNRYKPNMVFATDVENENDIAFLMEAKRRGIKAIGMVRSWDNLTILSLLRFFPDKLLVWNNVLKEEAIRYNGIPAETVEVVGIPQFDRYLTLEKPTKEEFYKKIGGDPKKKLILFTPVGDLYQKDNDTDRLTLDILKEIGENVIVRFPPGDTVSHLESFIKPETMYFDQPGVVYKADRFGDRDLSQSDNDMLINSLYHADIVVTGPSTIAIEAALFDKPIIMVNIHARQKNELEGLYSYKYNHIIRLLAKGGVRIANTADEFRTLVSEYLQDPAKDREGRYKIITEQCAGAPDGHASKRLAKLLLSELKI